jgi:hypothetical protein
VASIREWRKNSYDEDGFDALVPQREPLPSGHPHAVLIHRAAGAVYRARAGLLGRVPGAAVPHVHGSRARPEDTGLSREARQRRLRHADHAWRAAPWPAVSRPAQASLRGHRRAEQSPSQGRLAGPLREAVDAVWMRCSPTIDTAGWGPSGTSGRTFVRPWSTTCGTTTAPEMVSKPWCERPRWRERRVKSSDEPAV